MSFSETKAGFLGDALALAMLLVDPQLDLLETTFCQRPLGRQSRGPRGDTTPASVWRHTVGQLYRNITARRQIDNSEERPALINDETASIRQIIRERKAAIDAELEELTAHYWRAERERDAEWRKIERYCQDQRTVLRQLEDLNARAQQMYELNNDKDQVMTVCKLALANLVMWTRDEYFPSTYAQASWHRLAPFFDLPGQVTWERTTVHVALRPFNDQTLARDLMNLCERVSVHAPHLPDGRQLVMTVGPPLTRNSDLHRRC